MGLPIVGLLHGPEPYAQGQGTPFFNSQLYLGGQIFLIPSAAANTDVNLTHTLGSLPRGMHLLDAGTVQGQTVYRGSVAWSANTVCLRFNVGFSNVPHTVLIL